MLINRSNITGLEQGFSTAFNKGFEGAQSRYREISMVVPSSTKTQNYVWLGQFPKMREWLGDRIIRNLSMHGYTLANRKFEDTISVSRESIEDDEYGVFGPMFTEMGRVAAEFPDELIFKMLSEGFTKLCYDGQNFFDTDHPVKVGDNDFVAKSNIQAGAGEPWFLLDCSRAIKPLIYQERIPFNGITRLDNESDQNVFMRDEYLYGLRGRANAGFGLWQLAYASRAELNAENYEAARKAMMTLRGDEDRPLGIKPDTLVCGPNLEGAAMRLLNNGTRIETVDDGTGTLRPVSIQNEWANTAKPIVTAWLVAA